MRSGFNSTFGSVAMANRNGSWFCRSRPYVTSLGHNACFRISHCASPFYESTSALFWTKFRINLSFAQSNDRMPIVTA